VIILDDTAVRFTLPSSEVAYLVKHIEKCEVISDNGTQADVVVYWGIEEFILTEYPHLSLETIIGRECTPRLTTKEPLLSSFPSITERSASMRQVQVKLHL